jgi:hypothetical protein
MKSSLYVAVGTIALAAVVAPCRAADITLIGPWNTGAAQTALGSPLVTSAMAFIRTQLATVKDETIRRETEDAVFNADTCVHSRIGVDDAKKQAILQALETEGLIDVTDGAKFPGGLVAGVFPPLRDEDSACPKLPQPYTAAPGSFFGGHHSEPGGLAIHVAVNLSSAINLAATYRRVYGTDNAAGLPVVASSDMPGTSDPDFEIDQDIVVATPIWHDWAKTIVFQWNSDGSEFPEFNFAGNGKTDKWGEPGSTKTGAHHIISVAETIARGLPPAFIIAQASAHGSPTSGNEHATVNYIRAAALLAGVDPVAKGYLVKDAAGHLRVAPVRRLGATDITAALPNQSNLLYEYVLHNISDSDYTFTQPAVAQSELFLRLVAAKFGYDPADVQRYNTGYRNPVLSYLGAERVAIFYAHGGLDAVEREVAKVKTAGALR